MGDRDREDVQLRPAYLPGPLGLRVPDGQRARRPDPTGSAGEILTMVDLQRADGTEVYAMTSNVSANVLKAGGNAAIAPTINRQPLTKEQLVKIVTLPGMKF